MASSLANIQFIAHMCSTLIIISCLYLKVPQILHIREKRSADGIYMPALFMEITGFSIMTLYNYTNKYSVTTYLEYPIILVQVYVLIYQVLKYKRMLDLFVIHLATAIYFLLVILLAVEVLPKTLLALILPLCTPLSGFAKVMYIFGIVQAGNANAVSLTTWVISVATNLARVFTVYVDSGDLGLMSNFTISALLSTGVLLTANYYQRRRKLVNLPPSQENDQFEFIDRRRNVARHQHAD